MIAAASPNLLRLFTGDDHEETFDNSLISLSDYYENFVLKEIEEDQSPGSIKEDRNAIRHFERILGVRDIRSYGKDDIKAFSDGLKVTTTKAGKPLSPSTINKIWREVKAVFSFAHDAELINRVPSLGYRKKSRLVRIPPKIKRETITHDEMDRLWDACRFATYPTRKKDCWRSWQVLLCMFYTYGQRTTDTLNLRWDQIHWKDRNIRLIAKKTSKLQSLPLTDVVIRQLQSLPSYRSTESKIFPGFTTSGHQRSNGTWKTGWRATWRREILPAAGFSDRLIFKNFRETVATRYNTIEAGLGNWITAHYVQGVTAEFYDNPTQRIREAIENCAVPECFLEEISSDVNPALTKTRRKAV